MLRKNINKLTPFLSNLFKKFLKLMGFYKKSKCEKTFFDGLIAMLF